MYLIKRYKDRRLYDTIKRKYLNLKKIITLIKQGEEIKVIDKNSGADITEEILKKSFLYHPFSLSSLIKESFCAGLDAFIQKEKKVSHFLYKLVKEGRISFPEAKNLKEELLAYLKKKEKELKTLFFPEKLPSSP